MKHIECEEHLREEFQFKEPSLTIDIPNIPDQDNWFLLPIKKTNIVSVHTIVYYYLSVIIYVDNKGSS